MADYDDDDRHALDDVPPDEGDRSEMGFLSHLEDLRLTLLRCGAVFILFCILTAVFYGSFADVLSWPLRRALGDQPEIQQGLVTTSPMAVFSVLIQICLMGGLALSLPFMLYFFGRFIAPGLSIAEKRILLPSCVAVMVLFLAGAALSYFFILQMSLAVSVHFNRMFGFELLWNAPNYYGLVVWMTIGVGMCFEFPLVLILLQYLGVISSEFLARYRRHAIVVMMVIAALISPGGDPISLFALSLPLYLLYEVAIVLGRWLEKKKQQADDAFMAE